MDKLGLLKRLRDATAISMTDCKVALEKTNYDYDSALTVLREMGKMSLSKKAGRATSNGLVGIKEDQKRVAIVAMGCETDFVSVGEDFRDLLDKALALVLDAKSKHMESFIENHNDKLSSIISDAVAKYGENTELKSIFYKEFEENEHCVYYIHNKSPKSDHMGSILACVIFRGSMTEDVKMNMRNIAMHIVASSPEYLYRSQVPEAIVEEEKRIYREQSNGSGKPESIIERMINGRLEKFFADSVLMEQDFVVNPELKVAQLLDVMNVNNSNKIEIVDFILRKIK